MSPKNGGILIVDEEVYMAITSDQLAITSDQLAITSDKLAIIANQLVVTADQLAVFFTQSWATVYRIWHRVGHDDGEVVDHVLHPDNHQQRPPLYKLTE